MNDNDVREAFETWARSHGGITKGGAPASPVATSGSVLVPAEPTPEMAKAGCFRYCNAFVRDYKAMLAAAPVAQGEPVAEVAGRSGSLYIIFLPAGRNLGLGDKLYAAPQPVREVQPLTDEQAKEVMRALNDSLTGVKGWGWIDVIRAVERAHGITKGEA